MLNETFAIAAPLQIVAEPGVSGDTLLVQVADSMARETGRPARATTAAAAASIYAAAARLALRARVA